MKLRRFAAGLAITPLLITLLPVTAAADSSCWHVRRAERKFAQKMNRARINQGKIKLSLDPEASRVARKHTYEMANKKSLYHTPTSLLAWRITRWSVLAENIGAGDSVKSLHRAFMDSPDHTANILSSSFRHVGIGTVRRGGRLWVTVVFESVADPGTRLKMPSC